MKRYEIIIRRLDFLREGEELTLQIRDGRTYEQKIVRAFVARDPEDLPDGDELIVRNSLGVLFDPEPWRIKILEEIDDFDIMNELRDQNPMGLDAGRPAEDFRRRPLRTPSSKSND